MDRSGLGGKSGGHSVYKFFIRAAALSTLVFLSYHGRSEKGTGGGKLYWRRTYIGARQEALDLIAIGDLRLLYSAHILCI